MKGSLLEELLELHTYAEIEDWFWTGVIHPLIQIFKDRQEAQYHNISEKIIDLVQQHYETDLTLEECASRLHYNANYLSSVFRKETNHSFSEYLSMYRFKMAKKWLVGNRNADQGYRGKAALQQFAELHPLLPQAGGPHAWAIPREETRISA